MYSFADYLRVELNKPGVSAPPRQAPRGYSFDSALHDFDWALRTAQAEEPAATPVPPCLERLGLTLPCTEVQIKQAFRSLALRTHPDLPGGSHEAFLEAKAALDEALKLATPAPPIAA